MPTIKQAVEHNKQLRLRPPDVSPITRTVSTVSNVPLLTSQAPPLMPIRSIFPPQALASDQVTAGSQPFRTGLRSSVWSSPVAVLKQNTPQTLTNKKLLSPTVGGGSSLNRYNTLTGVLTPASVAAGATVTQFFTVAGVKAADRVIGYQWVSAQLVGVHVLAVRVTGDNTVAVDFSNPTGGPLTPTGGKIFLFLVQ